MITIFRVRVAYTAIATASNFTGNWGNVCIMYPMPAITATAWRVLLEKVCEMLYIELALYVMTQYKHLMAITRMFYVIEKRLPIVFSTL